DPIDNSFVRISAILAKRHFTQQKITQLISAIMSGERKRIDHIANRLRHFLAAVEQKTMDDDLTRERNSGRHQERRPIDRMKSRDVLADHMRAGGPKIRTRCCRIW